MAHILAEFLGPIDIEYTLENTPDFGKADVELIGEDLWSVADPGQTSIEIIKSEGYRLFHDLLGERGSVQRQARVWFYEIKSILG